MTSGLAGRSLLRASRAGAQNESRMKSRQYVLRLMPFKIRPHFLTNTFSLDLSSRIRPLPPSPALIRIVASSMNMVLQAGCLHPDDSVRAWESRTILIVSIGEGKTRGLEVR